MEEQGIIVNYNGVDVRIENPKNLCSISKRFKQLYEQNNRRSFSLSQPGHSVEVFRLFTTACQGKQFAGSVDNIFELNDMAHEWEAQSLIEYCRKFLEKSKIEDMSPESIVEALENVDQANKEEFKKLTKCAASKFSQVIKEERFGELKSDVITQIFTRITSEEKQQEIVNFVVALTKKDPSKAATLYPWVNFDLLTGKQYAAIFKHDSIEVATNYYNARAISDAHKSLKSLIKGISSSSTTSVNAQRERYEKKFNAVFTETIKTRAADLDKIRLRLVQQNEDLNDLAEVLENQKALLVECVKICHKAPASDEYLKIAKKEVLEMIKTRKAELLKQIEDDKDDAAKELEDLLAKSQKEIEANTDGKIVVEKEVIDRINGNKQSFTDINNNLVTLAKDIHNETAAVMAKILRDKIRGNDYLRITTDSEGTPLSYKIFDELPKEQLWDLTKEEVRSAEKRIVNAIETRFDKLCGIKK